MSPPPHTPYASLRLCAPILAKPGFRKLRCSEDTAFPDLRPRLPVLGGIGKFEVGLQHGCRGKVLNLLLALGLIPA